MKATATIKHDHLSGEYDGKVLSWNGGTEDISHESARFALYDDDGELYYTGWLHSSVGDMDEAAEALFDWSMVDSGTTRILVDGVDLIG